ncbi:glycosyltransferase family 2 protein [Flavobacterium sp. RHBU_3]|uniref:glycosyltransferase family 2 protein n=1 Tax=Flavobacterium sp. RHBU_3 TaxID=3391184 RepID=UPI0039852900
MDKNVFVIIVTYNGARWIDKLIPSLLASSYPVRIIAVDNQSTDNTVALLQHYPEVDIIETGSNLGFGKANNIGIQKALELGADYLFLLNQDAWVFADTVRSLVTNMEANTQVGLLSPMHFQANETDYDTSFATYLSRKTDELNGLPLVPFVNAAAWMLSRKCVEKVGYFEPLFGHYGEDRNYCDRVAFHNFQIAIDTNARIVHDRVISRNFNKDITQSQYKILSALINPKYSLSKAYIQGAKETLGLPKYFAKFYGWGKALSMLGKLSSYYLNYVFNPAPVKAARKRAL